jgi:hypothetical protein
MKYALAMFVNAEPQLENDECISGIREDSPRLFYNRPMPYKDKQLCIVFRGTT